MLWISDAVYETTNFGNKLNFLDANCLRELDMEMSYNASSLVNDLYSNGQVADIFWNIWDVVSQSVDPINNIINLDQVGNGVSLYLKESIAKLQIKGNMTSSARNLLQKLCRYNHCCYYP